MPPFEGFSPTGTHYVFFHWKMRSNASLSASGHWLRKQAVCLTRLSGVFDTGRLARKHINDIITHRKYWG